MILRHTLDSSAAGKHGAKLDLPMHSSRKDIFLGKLEDIRDKRLVSKSLGKSDPSHLSSGVAGFTWAASREEHCREVRERIKVVIASHANASYGNVHQGTGGRF